MNNKIKFRGKLEFDGRTIPCYVLEDKTRVLSEKETIPFLNLLQLSASESFKEFIHQMLKIEDLYPIVCYDRETPIRCYKATAIVDTWSVLCDMDKGEKLTNELNVIFEKLSKIVFALAKYGMNAVLDEIDDNKNHPLTK